MDLAVAISPCLKGSPTAEVAEPNPFRVFPPILYPELGMWCLDRKVGAVVNPSREVESHAIGSLAVLAAAIAVGSTRRCAMSSFGSKTTQQDGLATDLPQHRRLRGQVPARGPFSAIRPGPTALPLSPARSLPDKVVDGLVKGMTTFSRFAIRGVVVVDGYEHCLGEAGLDHKGPDLGHDGGEGQRPAKRAEGHAAVVAKKLAIAPAAQPQVESAHAREQLLRHGLCLRLDVDDLGPGARVVGAGNAELVDWSVVWYAIHPRVGFPMGFP
ncbi:hypothetical protein PoMZ_03738 [Pyricularia oryzae]|uniref:Uncharacterized protein n=1 Tax=Pyricularia oryzae TaxID=318829 RepID=A0A4P7ND46_PYROR|nr:hypothetical protein PoMZ_03738 [Pyricularia oryzae]